MRRLFLSLLVILAPLAAQAACGGRDLIADLPEATRADLLTAVDAVPFPRGNLWRATRDDDVLTIVGTFHLDDPRHLSTMARLAPLIDTARTVLVEAGPDEEAELKANIGRDPSLMFIVTGPTLPESLDADTWGRLQTALRDRSIPPFLGAKMQPAYLSMILGVPPCAVDALSGGDNGLDKKVIEYASEKAIPVQALEPYDTVFKVFSGMTSDEQLEMLKLSLALDGQAEDVFATIRNTYFTEDSRMMWEFSRWQTLQTGLIDPARVDAEYAEMEEALMASRNRAWIPVIEEALNRGPAFAAFGALHLSGQDGVLALLERNGFRIDRLDFQ